MARKPLAQLKMTDDNDNAVVLDLRMRDILLWEQRFAGRSVSMLEETRVKLTYLYEIAFIVASKNGDFDGKFEDFKQTFEVEEVDDLGVTVDPTQTAASTDESSVSLSQQGNPFDTGSGI
jgi:hypothetical protein